MERTCTELTAFPGTLSGTATLLWGQTSDRAKLLHCFKIKKIKEISVWTRAFRLRCLPDVRVIMVHYSHSCLHEMEENPLILFTVKRIEEEKAKAASRSQPQHNCSFQGPSSPRSLARRPLYQFSTFKAANSVSQPTQGALIQFLMESITYLQIQLS